ncbi:MAG: hypothetical protein DCF25_08235 [Leptolyngbya foveolarum]|uniref:Uncharacterized protein n=1 Tax=Leptolyngbya foveolarum TaxID=47253 RepID=A0A2W4URK8_9CYAN|nr:MAG: hypothetical protein DCF25_08235 [Leptolyngbya foveolarum]
MTSQQDQIQSLINDIERALSAQRSNKPWIRSSDVEPERVALAQAQEYLKSLQQTFDAPGGWGPVNPQTGQIADVESTDSSQTLLSLPAIGGTSTPKGQFGQFSGGAAGQSEDEAGGVIGQSAEHVLQALLTEMKYLKSSALEPLRLEMNELRLERDRLQSEVKSLDKQREAASNSLVAVGGSETGTAVSEEQLNDFLTALMGRLQETLTAQVGQTLGQLESDHAAAIAQLAADEEEVLQLRGSGQIEELRQLQGRSDQLLVNIDSTLQRMFETLQQNINSYQLSLNEGLESMHSLGRQGEVIVRALVDHLTVQLGQTTPPEPAFFPARSAAVPLVLVDEDAPLAEPEDLLDDTVDDGSPDDTVSSLNEVLPDLTSDVASTDTDVAVQPEDCIRADGTIDLDVLTLDIDRDEAVAIAPEDVMIDAAIADAQVAATESEDAEIEAKVMPTAESLYLADLTFDDLTVDPELSFDAVPDNLPVVSSDVFGASDTEADALAVAELDETELAAILPDLSEPSDELLAAEEAVSEPTVPEEAVGSETGLETDLEVDSDAVTELELPEVAVISEAMDDSATHLESSLVPDIPDANDALIDSLPLRENGNDALSQDLAAELEGVSREAERAATGAIEVDLDSLTSDLEETVVFEAETPEPAQLSAAADPLDSALIPDQPDADDREWEGSFQVPLDEMESVEADSRMATETVGAEVTAPLSPTDFDDDLDFYLEESNPAASETVRTEDDVAERAEDSDEDTVGSVEETAVEETATEEIATEEFPLEEVADVNAASVASTGIAATEAIAAMPPLLEPPFASPPASAPPVAEPIDPFVTTVTADLQRSFDEEPETEESIAEDPIAEDPIVEDPIVEDQPPVDVDEAVSETGQWFLGVDIGTTGLSAVLINQVGEQVYPLCWSAAGDESNRFRLPAIAQMIGRDRNQPGFGEQIGEVGVAALQSDDNRLLRHIKPLLKVGIPHGGSGEPWVQWSDLVALPLQEIQSALSELLKSLSAHRASCHAVGMPDDVLRRVLASLTGVVVGYPANWPDTYSFNIREAILAAGLVARGEQVFFIEETIAVLLSALPDPNMDPADIDGQQPWLYNCQWSGGTVVLSAGATLSEAAIANLPEDLEQLRYSDFATRSFGYAGDSLDQDIICQLLHVPTYRSDSSDSGSASEGSESSADEGWRRLGLNDLSLPQPGEADRSKRYRLRQRLNASELGRQAIVIAQKLKVDLQEYAQAEVSLGDRTWIIKRKDLETKVFLPYIQRVNRQINALLNQVEMSPEAVNQVICTGGSASLSAIARWLGQKFPNATMIIQDPYSDEYSNSCSRVAYGLANLCHYPNVLDGDRHRYSDYFLLLELLRILPNQPLPAGGILHLLEQRGIDTQACQMHILALIEGHLPPGLVPIDSDRPLISAQSPDIPTYKLISELPLFRKQGGQIYIADAEQGERLRQHLENVLAGKLQTLNEPQSLQLAAETVQ